MLKIFIEESSTLDDIEYDIMGQCENEEPIPIVKCWDYNLAEVLLKSVKDYIKTNECKAN